MKKTLTQTAIRTITLTREIVVEFPPGVDPETADPKWLERGIRWADSEWEEEDEDFVIEDARWSDADDDDQPHVIYED